MADTTRRTNHNVNALFVWVKNQEQVNGWKPELIVAEIQLRPRPEWNIKGIAFELIDGSTIISFPGTALRIIHDGSTWEVDGDPSP